MNINAYIGRICNEIDLKKTPNGISVSAFTIAVERPYKDANGEKQVDYIDCVAYRQTADFFAKYFKKGQRVGVNGAMQTRTYKDKDTGKTRKVFEVIVANVYFADGKATSGQTAQADDSYNNYNGYAEYDPFSAVASDAGDLPFGD